MCPPKSRDADVLAPIKEASSQKPPGASVGVRSTPKKNHYRRGSSSTFLHVVVWEGIKTTSSKEIEDATLRKNFTKT